MSRPKATHIPKIEKESPRHPGDRFDSEQRCRLGGPGLRTFKNIADVWQLSEEERLRVLGSPASTTFYDWLYNAREGGEVSLPVDTLLRISAVLGIHKALRIMFCNDADEVVWLTSPHNATTFGGQAPISLVASGSLDDLLLTRRYLDDFLKGAFV